MQLSPDTLRVTAGRMWTNAQPPTDLRVGITLGHQGGDARLPLSQSVSVT